MSFACPVVGKITIPKDAHVLCPEPVNVSNYMAKRNLGHRRKRIANYPGGPNLITEALKSVGRR